MLVNIYKRALFFSLLLLGGLALPAQSQVWSLEKCLDQALENNKNLQIGRNKIELGTQKQQEVKANLIPKVTLNADYRYFTNLPYQLLPLSVFGGPDGQFKEAQFGVPHNINANLQFSMPLYSPELRGAIRKTGIAADINNLQLQKSEEQLYFEISNLYFNAQILQHQLAFIDSNLVNSNKLLGKVKLLKEQLLAKGTDVSKVSLQMEQLNSQKQIIQSKIAQVLNGLKFAMGISPEQEIAVDPNIEYQDAKPYPSHSPLDIRLGKTQQRLLFSDLKSLKDSRLPTIALFANYGLTGYGYDKSPNGFLDFYPIGFVGIRLNYTLFNGTVTQKKIVQKNLELKNNELQLQLLSEQNNMKTANAKLQRQAAQKTVEASSSQIDLAQTVYAQVVVQQKNGLATLTDILLADNALRQAQQNYLSAIVAYLKADLELKKLSGNILK